MRLMPCVCDSDEDNGDDDDDCYIESYVCDDDDDDVNQVFPKLYTVEITLMPYLKPNLTFGCQFESLRPHKFMLY